MSVAVLGQKASEIPTAKELVARAAAMVPGLRARADAIEEARRVPDDVIDMFREAGFFRILQPKKYGGWEMNPIVFMRVLGELGRGCCASAWAMMILGVHNWEFGVMDDRAAQDVWGEDDQTIIASSYPPVGELTKVEGGWRLKGRWPTSSGSDHGTWAFIGALERNEKGVPIDRHALLVKREDYEIIDDWYTFGLSGTGSKSLLIKDAFIPDHRAHSMIDYKMDDRPTNYLFPFAMVFYSSVSSVIIGFAQGAIDVFIDQMQVRVDNGSGAATRLSPYVKDRLANAVAKVRASQARMEQMMAHCTQIVERRELVSTEDRIHYMLDMARIGRECEEAVLTLYKCTGARGVYKSNPIQRYLRDTLVAANHVTQDADNNAGALGGYLLSGELPPLLYEKPKAD
ncbi:MULTISPECIES: acyl-CoA dehydrogenase family protein [unclassified Sphingobium]|uniref:acyl-CoA dehydrogenase family protein n=1 Tax=unclassified Sphingobium TaxID=2611147 RepID=UPI00076FE83E|nr:MULTISPECIES: acyl-CoA dehydrogenase family protein [unclassified Sphingobium]AMK24100.1 acyl-CoA dehydrogenase type 2 [Sphingobium sp. TKS]NML89104.1 acyl-CoA dehydrogenase [Sphingobium sp. TB-6]